MATNLFHLTNVVKTSLNLNRTTRRVALIGLFISLAIGNAWAGHGGPHYGNAQAKVSTNSTGKGQVYAGLATTNSPSWNNTESTSATYDCSTNNNTDSYTAYFYAQVTANGYYFKGWSTSDDGTIVTGSNTSPWSTTLSTDGTSIRYAIFSAIPITATNATKSETDPTAVRTWTQTFTHTGGDATADFSNAEIVSKSGGGVWTHVSTVYTNSTTVTVTYTYSGNRTSVKNKDGNRTDVAELTLYNADKATHATSTITVNYPELTIDAIDSKDDLSPVSSTTKYTGTATFSVSNADAIEDFNWSIVKASGEGTWAIEGTPTYSGGTVTINYSYTGNGSYAVRNNSATLTLSSAPGTALTTQSKSTTINANYSALSISAGSAADLTPTKPSTTYSGTATFPVRFADGKDDFETSIIGTGVGSWAITSHTFARDGEDDSKGTITVNFTYTTADTYGDAAARTNSAVVTLQKAGDSSVKQTVTVNANLPAITFGAGDDTGVYPSEVNVTEQGTVTIPVQYADGLSDFTTPSITGATGGTFAFVDFDYEANASDVSQGTITVHYTYTGSAVGVNTATLTVSATIGASQTVTLNANILPPSDHDASVTTAGGATTEYEHWADAFTAANGSDGCTIKLLRSVSDVNTTQTITKTMTIDLNGYTLSGTGATFKIGSTTYYGLFYISTANKTLTINDSRSGGKIKVLRNIGTARLYGITANSANIILNKGTIDVENPHVYTSATADKSVSSCPIFVTTKATFTMNGGELISTAGRNAFGVLANGTTVDANRSVVTIEGGTISAYAPVYAYGIYSYGLVNVNGGVINATTKALYGATGGAYAYAVSMVGSANATTASNYWGTLNMTGGTLNATAATSDARGVYLWGSSAHIAEAVDGTHSNKACSQATITGGNINVQSDTLSSYGVYVTGSYNSRTNEVYPTSIKNCTIKAKRVKGGSGTPIGVFGYAAVAEKTAAKYQCEIEMDNVTIESTCDAGGNAYGVQINGGSRNIPEPASTGVYPGNYYVQSHATIKNCDITAKSPSSSVGIYCLGLIDFSNTKVYSETTSTDNAYGVIVAASAAVQPERCFGGVFTMTSGTIEAKAARDAAYGIQVRGSNSGYVASATDGSITNKAAGQCLVSGGTITVRAERNNSYGVYSYASHDSRTSEDVISVVRNATITSTAKNTYAYGVRAHVTADDKKTGAMLCGNLTLYNNTVTAKTEDANEAYGVIAASNEISITSTSSGYYKGKYIGAGKITVYSGSYTAESATTGAYAACAASQRVNGTDTVRTQMIIYNGTFTATAGTSTARAISTNGNTAVNNGTFTATAGTTTAVAVWVGTGICAISGGSFTANATTTTAYGFRLETATGRGIIQGGTFTATSNKNTATGLSQVNATNLEVTGGTFKGVVTGDSIFAATSDINAHGVYIESGTCVANISNATIEAYLPSNLTNTVYGVRCAGTLTMNNCTITADTKRNIAYGLKQWNGKPATIKDCAFNVTASFATTYGIHIDSNNTSVDVENCTFTADSRYATAYGVYLNNGILNASGTTFDVTTHQDTITIAGSESYTRGIWVNTGKTANVSDCYINATVANSKGKNAWCFYNQGNLMIDGGEYIAKSGNTQGYAIYAHTNSTYTKVYGGKFKGTSTSGTAGSIFNTSTKGKTLLYGGIYNTNENLSTFVADDYQVTNLASTRDEYKAPNNYRYEILPNDMNINYVCQIGSNKYKTLEEALQVISSGQTVYMLENYTLPAGTYTLPSGATLLVPYKSGSGAGASTAIGKTASRTTDDIAGRTAFKKLTFASGVRFTCNGIIEVSARQKASGGANTGQVQGPYGQIVLQEGARIDLESGAKIQAWGYITGKGEIVAKNGSEVRELFVLGDWKGGAQGYALYGDSRKMFPITHYFYQNIECPLYYKAGAKGYGATAIYASSSTYKVDDVKVIGTESDFLFKMTATDASSDQWVKKEYIPAKDSMVYTMNSGATLSSITLSLAGNSFSSSEYVLPIASNMEIVLHEGTSTIAENTFFSPGSKLIVDKLGTCAISKNVYFYDSEDFTYPKDPNHTDYTSYSKLWAIGYSPSWTKNPRSLVPVDAQMFVHGKVAVAGQLYTTEHGSNIHSTVADAGTITYSTAATTGTSTLNQHTSGSGSGFSGNAYSVAHTCTAAQLCDEDGTFHATAGTTTSQEWVYMLYDSDDGRGEVPQWVKITKTNDCFTVINDKYFAHPSDYVEVAANASDHAYHDAAHSEGAEGCRYFIYTNASTSSASCTWWECGAPVVISGTTYYIANQERFDNFGTYYYYDSGTSYWKAKTTTINWKNYDGSWLKMKNSSNQSVNATYTMNFNNQPIWVGTPNPTRSSSDANYYYVWTGWDTSTGNTGAAQYGLADGDLPLTNADEITYYAHFDQKYYQYNITFKNADGSIIESKLCNKGSLPVCSVTPTKAPSVSEIFTFNNTWTPALQVVSGTAEYTANYTASPRPYTITFYNYDGKSVLESKEVNFGEVPEYTGSTPTKPDDAMSSYTFTGWNKELVAVSGDASYIATFSSSKFIYHITFVTQYGDELGAQDLEYGEMPTFAGTPTKEATEQYTYTFAGWDPPFAIATEPATYTALFSETLRTYALTISATPAGYGSVSATSVADVAYGSTLTTDGASLKVNGVVVCTATPASSDAQYTYTFKRWNNVPATVSGNVTNIQAEFERSVNTYALTIAATPVGYGSVSTTSVADVAYGSTLTTDGASLKVNGVVVCTATPASSDAQYTYTFKRWNNVPATVSGNVTNIQAEFERTTNAYTLTWETDGDALTGTYTNGLVPYGTTIVKPADPTRTGYTFAGWSDGSSVVTPTTMPAANTTYTATWTCVSPTPSITSDKWDFCAGETMTLSVSGSDIAADAAYQWQKWNGSSWDNIAGETSDSYSTTMAFGKAGQYRCTVTNGSCTTPSDGVWVRVWQLHLGDDDIDFTNTGAGTGHNTTVPLSADTHYEFKLKDNTGGWFGLNSKTVETTTEAFALNGTGANVNVTAGMTGNYTFTINYSDKNNPTIAITYPTANQTAGYDIYFDKSVITDWTSESASDIYLRIGKPSHNKNNVTDSKTWSLVPGTDRFYTIKTLAYDGFEAWQIANNASWTGEGKSIYLVNTGDSYAITKATNFQKYAVDASGVTIVPTTSNNTENGCNYWNVAVTEGMLTHTATITTPTNGTITIANAAQSLSATATTAGIPHRTILTITATPNSGYRCTSLTVNGAEFTSGNTFILAADATIAATFEVAETGFYVDIVDVDNEHSKLTLNVAGWAAAGWPYTINGTAYGKDADANPTNHREDDRTLIIPYTGEAGSNFTLTVTRKQGQTVSLHTYIIPREVTSNTDISTLPENQVLFVKGATLTVDDAATMKNIYVAQDAKLEVEYGITLTADTVFLRTTPWAAAQLDNSGTIDAQVCYTRIIKSSSQYYQFGLPLSCTLSSVRLSDGTSVNYGSAWLLRSYSEYLRATTGEGNNWETLDGETIDACVGYEMFSAFDYYREFYFPVNLSGLTDKVAVSHTEGNNDSHEGWNIVVSPLTRNYDNSGADPVEGLKISKLQEDGSYDQDIHTTIEAAVPFSYQAATEGYLYFDKTPLTQKLSAPRRMTEQEETKETEWLHLFLSDADGRGDKTSIFVHPTRFADTYETGIDVAKQSFEASRALIYSTHAYGEMAFAGVSDELLEKGIPLTLYSPAEQKLTISMRENRWLDRMAFVWLIDKETGARTDLLMNDYRFIAPQGTTTGRFFIQGQFFAPQVATDIQNTQSDDQPGNVARKLLIDQKIYIQVNGKLYDTTGKLVIDK